MPPSEKEIEIVQKATVYDLIDLFETSEQKEYDVPEIKQIMKAYIKGSER